MEDKGFFDRALQVEAPWFVRSVKMDLQEKTVELEIGVEKGWRWEDGEDGTDTPGGNGAVTGGHFQGGGSDR